MIKILLAFDHELPLGKMTTSYDKAIFEPTDMILESATKHGFKVNLFTDILCALAFKENNIGDFYFKYKAQLHRTLQAGHDVQLHIHPHWIDTKFKDGVFEPSKSFKLADFKDNAYPNNIEGIVERSVKELQSICKEVKTDYACNSYRAGGYNLSPETERIINALYANGIRIDSSVVKDYYYKSELSEINFKNYHNNGNWFFPLSGPVNSVSETGMYEIPIASSKAGVVTNLKHLYYKRKYKKFTYTSGYPIHSGKVNKIDKLKFVFSARPLGFDIISLHSQDLIKIVEDYIKSQNYNGDIIISSVSHPKNMGTFSVKLMEDFVRKIRDKHSVEFCTFTDIYHQLSL